MATFTDIFNELLAENELNRKQFAEKCKIPYTTVAGWTNLGRLPDFTALIKLADFFGCSIDYLAGRQGNYEYVSVSTEEALAEQELIKNFRKLSGENKELVQSLTKNLCKKL